MTPSSRIFTCALSVITTYEDVRTWRDGKGCYEPVAAKPSGVQSMHEVALVLAEPTAEARIK